MDSKLAHAICVGTIYTAVFILYTYFTDLEADALEIAAGSDLVWPSFIGTAKD